jgi:hypothetical protein
MLQTINIENKKSCYDSKHNWRDALLQEYQACLENIEKFTAQQIMRLKQASPLEIQALFQQLDAQTSDTFPSQAEVEKTDFTIKVISKAVASVVDSCLEQVLPRNIGGNLLNYVVQKLSIEDRLLALVGINFQTIQYQQETNRRNCLIGAFINFKLKAVAMLREDYDQRCKASEADEAKAKVNLHIA